jgi:DNA-binding transcriptional LysR family regulator
VPPGSLRASNEFLESYPDIHLSLILTDEELDLAMREADVALRFRQPTQPDLIQRKLFTVHFHAYGSQALHRALRRPADARGPR